MRELFEDDDLPYFDEGNPYADFVEEDFEDFDPDATDPLYPPAEDICSVCDGTGTKNSHLCKVCQGTGQL